MQRVDLSVVLPAYNEGQRLPESLEHIVAYLGGRAITRDEVMP